MVLRTRRIQERTDFVSERPEPEVAELNSIILGLSEKRRFYCFSAMSPSWTIRRVPSGVYLIDKWLDQTLSSGRIAERLPL